MIRTLTMTSTIALLLALASIPAEAKGIKNSLSDQELATVCTELGLGEHTDVTVTSGGITLNGSVHCEAEDLVVGSDDSLDPANSPDDDSDSVSVSDDGDDDSLDDNGHDGSDDSSDDADDSSDDDSGHDGGDDSGHGGEGSDD